MAAAHEPITADYDGPRYCTGFLVSGSFPRELLERRLAALGDCLVVVSDGELVRAHLHTDDPGRALSAATTLGALSGVEISDMHAQRDALAAPLVTQPLAPLEDDGRLADILAVVDGDGNRVLYASLGARLLLGRPTGVRARRCDAREPGRGHRSAPQHARCRSSPSTRRTPRTCPVHVVPTRGLAQGLAALVAYRTDQPAAVLAAALRGGRLGGHRRGRRRRRRRCRGAARRGRPRARARLDARHGAGRRRGRERGARGARGLARRGASGRRARAARRRTGAPALLRERRVSSAPLTAERCAIVLDSTSDLPDCRERHANMRMVPLTVRFGDEELLDYEEISPQRFYERLAGDPLPPRTAAPPPERFTACYRELFESDGYEHVLSLHLSEALSATVSSARIAAAEFGDRVTVVDTRTVSIGLALAGLGIARQLEAAPCALEILVAEAEGFHRRSRLVFAFETLEFLQRNGRIGRGKALVGGLLGVRPLLTLVEGEVEPLGKVRRAPDCS